MLRDGRVGRVLADRYRLEAPIGVGASGRVYAAHDLRLDRPVAVKILDESLAADPVFVDRFHREVRTASQLTHPHVVKVFDWGDDPGPYLVTELVGGGSLAALLARGVRLSPEQAIHMGHDVAEALAAAHARGIVHRDVKPANLLFDERGDVRLADFGLARAMASASPTARRDAVFGTLRYAAPEQVGRDGADPRSDLYSLALVLVEAVTGAVPFDADDPARLIAARREQPIPIPVALGPLTDVIDRAGRVHPDDRLPDAATMARLLAQAARLAPEPEPVVVRAVRIDDAIDHLDPFPTELAPLGYGAAAPWSADTGRRRQSAPGPDRAASRALADPSSSGRASRGARRDRRRPRRSLLDRALAPMLVTLLIVAVALAAVISTTGGETADVRSLPNTVGGSLADAQLAISAAGLGPADIAIDRRFSHEQEGTVVGQAPAAGLPISADTPVTLLVSKGPELTMVPDLAAVDEPTARSMLASARLEVGAVTVEHNEFLVSGQLISQSLQAGSSPEVGAVIDLVYSDGPAPRTVPALAGLTLDEARAALAAADLGLVEPPGQEFSDDVELGRVIRQDLPPTSLTDRGRLVTVVVSQGPELVPVPALAGLTVEDATSRLRAVGLDVGSVFNYSPGGEVLQSDPTAGSELRKGSLVDLFVRRR
jgi:eukaryotic-like serine/threonine-protein kinase